MGNEPLNLDLFKQFERQEGPWKGTFWWGELTDVGLTDSFHEAALRLWRSAADAQDAERVLMPILYLFRHAIELVLKEAIMDVAELQRVSNIPGVPTPAKLVAELKGFPLRHDVSKLATRLDEQVAALGEKPISEETMRLLSQLRATDGGNSFRFPGMLPSEHLPLDMPALLGAFEAVYRELMGYSDWATAMADNARAAWD